MAERRPTRSQLVGTMVFDAVLANRLTWREYAQGVVDHYHDTVAPHDRVVEFQLAATGDQYEPVIRNNTQVVRRILSGERTMPADLEESLLAPLPPAARDTIMGALLERSGLMLARQPAAAGDRAGQVRCATELMRRAADAVDSVAPMLADNNRIGPEDAAHFDGAQAALGAVMSACVTLDAQIAVAREQVPAGVPARVRQSRDVH